MLESLVNPKRVEKGPWKMFFIGIVYASLSMILVHLFFSNDEVLSKGSGLFVVLFSVLFSMPFMYFLIKKEEEQDENLEGVFNVWQHHKNAIYAFMFLFLGFIVAFSLWNIIFHDSNLLNFQLQAYCQINSPTSIDDCVTKYSFGGDAVNGMTGNVTGMGRFLGILTNNIYVMIFTLIFSLIFGAGAIFILAWNASVISAAVGVFAKYKIHEIPLGIARYMIHGVPEIAAYFITALAGGILGVGIMRHGFKDKRFVHVLENVIILILIAFLILIIAGLIEVYFTPKIFA